MKGGTGTNCTSGPLILSLGQPAADSKKQPTRLLAAALIILENNTRWMLLPLSLSLCFFFSIVPLSRRGRPRRVPLYPLPPFVGCSCRALSSHFPFHLRPFSLPQVTAPQRTPSKTRLHASLAENFSFRFLRPLPRARELHVFAAPDTSRGRRPRH